MIEAPALIPIIATLAGIGWLWLNRKGYRNGTD